uniref:Uncharacterized protein n=1 Tax=Anguilla anguilla TaxID=7936 RepID=A0A0E9S2H2_ANGAN
MNLLHSLPPVCMYLKITSNGKKLDALELCSQLTRLCSFNILKCSRMFYCYFYF